MYNDHFRFSEAPFSIAPDPRNFYLSGQHSEAIAHLKYGVEAKGGFILLTGEVGTGKTTVCRCFLEHVPDTTRVAMLLNPPLSETELLQAICNELHIAYEASENVNKLTVKLNDDLLRTHAEGRRTLLIVEEAQHMDRAVLERLRLLTNLETDREKLLQVILIGQPELLEKVGRPDMKQLAQRVIARHHLRALTLEELDAYVDHRLKIVGGSGELFPASVRSLLYRLSGGVPRVVNLICDRALLGCYVQGGMHVDRKTLRRAAEEVLGDKAPRLRMPWTMAAAAAILATLGLAYLMPAPDSPPPDEMNAGQASAVGGAGTDGMTTPGDDSPVQLAGAPLASTSTPASASGAGADGGAWDAYQAVFARWGVAAMPPGVAPCEYAARHRLHCWHDRLSLSELLRVNRPAVVKLNGEDGATKYVALLSSSDGRALVHASGRETRIALNDLRRVWSGEHTVLWRKPPGYVDTLRLGYRGRALPWLATKLAHVNESNPRLVGVYGPGVMRDVRAFQRKCGLFTDGLAGRRTLIMLNSLTDRVPLLSKSSRLVCGRELS